MSIRGHDYPVNLFFLSYHLKKQGDALSQLVSSPLAASFLISI